MSDSFADLWSSSAPLPTKPKQPTLSSASLPNPNQSTSKPDVFALLSSSGVSTPTPRYGNGATANRSAPRPSNPPSRTMSPSTSSQVTTSVKSDAFSDLFSSTTTSNTSNMTMAARLAMDAEQRRLRGSPGVQKAPSVSTAQGGHSAWTGLDSLGISFSASIQPSTPSVSSSAVVDDEDDWGLGDFGKSTSTALASANAHALRQPQGHTQTTAQATAQPAEKKKKGVSLWDMEEFSGVTPSSSASTSIPARSPSSSSQKKRLFEDEGHVDSPDQDFDFGSREDRVDSRRSDRKARGRLLDFDDDGDRKDRKRGLHHGLLDEEDLVHDSVRGGIHDEDDILGMLGKPVDVVRQRAEPEVTSRTLINHHTLSKPTRSASPPPHILGQIVAMGFSVSEAKKALAATKDGQDVQAALESLLSGGGTGSEGPAPGPASLHRSASSSRTASQPPPPPPTRTRGAPKGQKERERERLERQRLQLQQAGEGAGIPTSVAEVQEHADRLLSQASEIGSSMFSKASAFWKEGKEKVIKAYEERTGDSVGISSSSSSGCAPINGGGTGRPRWMQETVYAGSDEAAYEGETSAFRDDHEDHVIPSSQDCSPRRTAKPQGPAQEVNLFTVHDEPQKQQRKPSPQPRPKPVRQVSSSSSIRASTTRTVPATAPVPLPTRNLVTASPSALSLAQKHKAAGTEQFKLGQHGPAAESYSSAISALPGDHLLLVPLLTNRALTRLKTGEYAGAIVDCEKAVEVILGRKVFGDNTEAKTASAFRIEDPLAHHSKSVTATVPPPMLQPSTIPPNLISAGRSRANGGGWTHPQGVGVDLLDAYVKALRRAAEAFEGREKWVEACAWWSVLSQMGEGQDAGWVDEKARKEAVVGGVRCRKMVDGGESGLRAGTNASKPTQQSASKPKPKPHPIPQSTEPSKALEALQATNAQAEADNNAKYALKDSVDARLTAWKGGKETNIRALLASLETVLWEGASGVQGLRMGMADLVSAGQVKKGYIKAIARVHPDKLNAGNSTLEQRMLASGVFAGLNEAWISFQATQK